MFALDLNIVVMCGGKGTRTGSLAAHHGSKSFIPIGGVPALEYVISNVRSIPRRQIYFCIEREELKHQLSEVLQRVSIEDASIYIDSGLGAMHALHELRDRLDKGRTLVLFGHHLVYPGHIEEMLTNGADGVVLSLYKTSSDNLRKVILVDEGNRCCHLWRGDENTELVGDQLYGDVPYLLPPGFLQSLRNRPIRSYDAIKNWFDGGGAVYGQPSLMPHEFHFVAELKALREIAHKFQENF